MGRTGIGATAKVGVSFALLTSKIVQFREDFRALHVFWTCRAGARPYRVQCRVARCDMGLPAQTSHPLSRLFACFAGPIPWAKAGRLRPKQTGGQNTDRHLKTR
jgi:hypothetical protein